MPYRAEHLRKDVEIALVGKYTKLEDAYASVIKALNHASLALNYRLRLTYIAASDLENSTKMSNPVQFHEAWKTLCQCQGVLIPGGFGQRGIEGKVAAAQWARTTNKPLLGISFGLQTGAKNLNLSQNSHFVNHIFEKIKFSKYHFSQNFTILKSHFSQNSQF